MEDILDIYEMPYDPVVPVVCMDGKPYQLLGEAREPLPMRSGDTQKVDSEYIRNGTCSIFVFVEPLGGVRHVSVREHRTAVDWAERTAGKPALYTTTANSCMRQRRRQVVVWMTLLS